MVRAPAVERVEANRLSVVSGGSRGNYPGFGTTFRRLPALRRS